MALINFPELLEKMDPAIVGRDFVFCTTDKTLNLNTNPVMTFREKEGTTFVVKKESIKNEGLKYEDTWDLITLNVNSGLNAVGFLSKITGALAKENIPVNAASAFHHDHLFVPASKSEQALKVLTNLSDS